MRKSIQLGVASLSVLVAACGRTRFTNDQGAAGGPAVGVSGASSQVAGAPAHLPASGGAGATASTQPGAGANGEPQPTPTDWQGSPIYTRVSRLTSTQWTHTVTDILRLDQSSNPTPAFQPAPRGTTEFINNERLLFVGQQEFTDIETAAESAAALATGSPSALAALSSETTAAGFVRVFGKRAFRRPLTSDEQAKYEQLFSQGQQLYGPSFQSGASLVIRAMLQSPKFLYRSELGPAGEPLSGYELASKLSFWLLDTTPSDELLDDAGAGKLDSVDALEQTARQMLEDARARGVVRDFHDQLYRLHAPLPGNVPEYTDALHAERVDASHRFFDDIFTRNGGLRDIFTSDSAFIGPNLAPLYGIDPPPSAIERRKLGASRIGYFTQVPFLIFGRDARDPDSMARGAELEYQVLCGLVGVDLITVPIPPLQPHQTNRQRMSLITDACGSLCHKDRINALGFAFENFDGLGRERSSDNGQPVDTSGRYPFTEGVQEFANAPELMQLLANSAQAHFCYAKEMAGYALQRDIIERDAPLVKDLAKVSGSKSIKELIVSIVRAPAFRVREGGQP